ncbi:hypothetical protein J6X15_03080 [Candidatus Saccharibacteria bacterium]|nr:hypothetical protein [Candidatus Saccharibacteria bacterium]MBP5656539.1 hypothetical protein [Candidatus Saccharibacteria bacterium]
MSILRIISSKVHRDKTKPEDTSEHKLRSTEDALKTGKICPYCGGSGIRNNVALLPAQRRCDVCGGSGRIPL